MKHHLFTILAAFSLLPCIASLVLGVRSYWRSDSLGCEGPVASLRPQWGGTLFSAAGDLEATIWRRQNPNARPSPQAQYAFFSGRTAPQTAADRRQYLRSLNATQFIDFAYLRQEVDARPGGNPNVRSGPPQITQTIWIIGVPYWSLVITTAILPTIWLLRTRRQRRRQYRLNAGLCVRCGYDLRASADKCPECGSPIPASYKQPITTNN